MSTSQIESRDCLYRGHQYTLSITDEGKMLISHSLLCSGNSCSQQVGTIQ